MIHSDMFVNQINVISADIATFNWTSEIITGKRMNFCMSVEHTFVLEFFSTGVANKLLEIRMAFSMCFQF